MLFARLCQVPSALQQPNRGKGDDCRLLGLARRLLIQRLVKKSRELLAAGGFVVGSPAPAAVGSRGQVRLVVATTVSLPLPLAFIAAVMAVTPARPPSCMVSRALLGTSTIVAFCLSPS